MENASQREFNDALETYHVSLHQFKPEEWKKVVIDHAKGNYFLKSQIKCKRKSLGYYPSFCITVTVHCIRTQPYLIFFVYRWEWWE